MLSDAPNAGKVAGRDFRPPSVPAILGPIMCPIEPAQTPLRPEVARHFVPGHSGRRLLLFLACILVCGPAAGCSSARRTLEPPASPSPPPTSTTDPWDALGAPARLEIPAIGIAAPLEPLGLDEEQRIEAPERWDFAGWYDVGFRPGEAGNALISGHYDREDGEAAVFYRLGELEPGQRIYVSYPGGERYRFLVEDRRMVDAAAVDRAAWDAIFGPADEPRLSLVTCDGVWDAELGSYDQRLILHASLEAVESGPPPSHR